MKMSIVNNGLLIAATLCLSLSASAGTHAYPSGVKVAVQIGHDLYDSLDAKYREKLQEPPVCAVPANAPELTLVSASDDNKALGQLSMSVGYVDLINHIAHAKAIDHVEPGYFDKYMSGLANDNGNPPSAPEIIEDRFWSDDIMNEQASYFNQMMGMTMAINLSRHYLGQYSKYSSHLQDGKLVPINNFLTSSEWDSGVRAGAVNSLNCAFGTEGAKALFDAIGKMAHRPAWTAYIVPQNIDITRLNKQLAKYEVDFFHGGLN
jgi:hypothetical protein